METDMETITREYTRRADDKPIGTITVKVPSLEGWKVEVDGKTYDLPVDSVFATINFGLQMHQDAYAGKKLRSEAIAAFLAKRDRWISGTLGARSAATGATAVERAAWSLAIKDILAALKVKTVAKLADSSAVESETGEPYVTITDAGNVTYNAAAMRAFVARNDAKKEYTSRAEAIVAAKAAESDVDVEL
jgi:hypothetical protein